MTIMLVAFGAMFAAAGSALKPLAEDADAAKSVQRMLDGRGDLWPGSRVRLSRHKAGSGDLADHGFGLLVRFQPSKEVRSRPGGLRAATMRAVQEALQCFPQTKLAWVEAVLVVGSPQEPAELRTLIQVGGERGIGEPTPALPRSVDPGT